MPSQKQKWRKRASLKHLEAVASPSPPSHGRFGSVWLWLAVVVVVGGVGWVLFGRSKAPAPSLEFAGTGLRQGKLAEGLPAPGPEASLENKADLARRYVVDGNDLLREGKLDAAIERFNEALQLDPNDEDIHFNLGIALTRKGNFDDAIQHYSEAIRILPQYAEARNNLGNVLVRLNRLEEAVAQFKASLMAMPQHSAAHNNLGTVLARQGKVDEAITHFSEAVRLQPDYFEAYVNLGSGLMSQGRTNEAIRNFEKALTFQPNFEPVKRMLRKAQGIPEPVPPGVP